MSASDRPADATSQQATQQVAQQAMPPRDDQNPTPTTNPKRKRDTDASQNPWNGLIKVLVGQGKDKESFTVHTHVLQKVPFFRGCLDADMTEKARRTVKLPEDDPRAFSYIVHWLYHGKLPVDVVAMMQEELKDDTSKCFSDQFDAEVGLLTKAYVLCHKLLMEELQNHLVDLFLALSRRYSIEGYRVRFICDNVPRGDKLRKLMMHEVAYEIHQQSDSWLEWKEKNSHYSAFAARHPEYMEAVAEALATYPSPGRACETKSCDWHVHIDTPKCK